MIWRYFWIICAISSVVLADDSVVVEDPVEMDGDDPADNKLDMNIPGFDKKLPSPDELLKMLDSMSNLSDEEKDELRQHLLKSNPEGLNEFPSTSSGGFFYQLATLLSLLGVVTVIFVFFGYKLYKSLIDREKRREMKKKQKEMKKKK